MKKIAAAAALFASATLTTQSASAASYTLYEFRVTSYACAAWNGTFPNQQCGGSYGLADINGMRVGIATGASGGQLTIKTDLSGPIPNTFESLNNNIEYAAFSRVGSKVDFKNEVCIADSLCHLQSSFEINSVLQLLAGSFYLLNSSDMIDMSSNGSTLWTGYYASDSIPSDRLVFTGIWYETPEPSPVVLIGAGLAGLIWVRRRKDTRQRD